MTDNTTNKAPNKADMSKIKTPCISVCTVDGLSGYCIGCYRSLNEISNWWVMDDAARDGVIALKDVRKQEVADKRTQWRAKQQAAQSSAE